MAFQQFFPCVPDYMSWEDWNGNLIMFYGQEPVPYSEEVFWASTAKSIGELPTFAAYPVPDPSEYVDWQAWARDFTEIINGPSS
jgi:hypothetical protein